MIASRIHRQLRNAHWRLYRLSEPIDDGEGGTTDYVIVSAKVVDIIYRPETYIFPARADGSVINFTDLPGSFDGAVDHDRAIREAGWTLVEEGA